MSGRGGPSKAIALVDAFDYSTAMADLQHFSSQFGLTAVTASNFQVVYAPKGNFPPGSCTGPATKPPTATGTGWDMDVCSGRGSPAGEIRAQQ